MLQQWEAGDEEVVSLWKTMNQWVYNGFDITYKNLGVDFDSYYYESETIFWVNLYRGRFKKRCFRKDDGFIWLRFVRGWIG